MTSENMKFRMQTLSGAIYAIDNDKLTWTRVGRIPILGLETDHGKLAEPLIPILGEGAVFIDRRAGPIHTTRVERLELL